MNEKRHHPRTALGFTSLMLVSLLTIPAGLSTAQANTLTASSTGQDALQNAFVRAAQEFGVPQNVLLSVAYNESRWNGHHGQPSLSGGYGVMHLTQVDNAATGSAKGDTDATASDAASSDPAQHTLDEAAALLHESPDVLKSDTAENVRGGAALLAAYARETVGSVPQDPAAWYGAVAKYSGSALDVVAKAFADDVYTTIRQGAEQTTPDDQHVVLPPMAVTPDTSTADSLHLHLRNATVSGADCPNGLACRFIPAAYQQFSSSPYNYGNYDLANRPTDGLDIRYIVIHDAEESYQGTIATFLAQSYVSAHYIVDSTTGQITEMVRPENIAWQAGNWYFNAHSIGIEHSGYAVEGGTWYSEQMYHASARLVKYLADRYHIPLDRQHILGHDNVPGLSTYAQTHMHWDPAAYWDWAHYFDLLGAAFTPSGSGKDSNVVTIRPDFATNLQPLTYAGSPLPQQPSDFVYLYTAPSFAAPLISDPALHPDGSPGTLAINDWGDKAVTGQSFYQTGQFGDWTAIDYGGQTAWFYNPNGQNTVPGSGLLVTPKQGVSAINVYGAAYPEASAFDNAGVPRVVNRPLPYSIPAGQFYVSSGAVSSDYDYAKLFNAPETYKVVQGNDTYYEISFNHRVAFVKTSDVDVVGNNR